MGLLDWLSDGLIGSGGPSLGGGMGEAGDTSSMVMPKPMTPMPPMQQTGADVAPPLPPSPSMVPTPPPGQTAMGDQTGIAPPQSVPPQPFAAGSDPMTAGGVPSNGPGLPPTPPFAAGTDPMTAGGVPSNGPGLPPGVPVPPRAAALPPNAAPTAGATPPGPPLPLGPSMGIDTERQMAAGSPQAKGIIGRALGLDPNREAQLRGSLGAGLKAAGENWNKPGLAALAGTAGSAIEGGKGADDKTTDQQDRFLQRKISAKNADNTAATGQTNRDLNVARTQLALAQAKQAMTGGKDSVMNSQQQLYLRGMGLVNNDPEVKLAKSTYDAALKNYDPSSKEVKAAAKAHADLVAAKTRAHMDALGVDPKVADRVGKQPGMSFENPVPKAGLTTEKFNQLPAGAYFVNPKDGRVLRKAAATGGNQPAAAQQPGQSMAPPVPPLPITAPAGSKADADEEED